MAILSSRNYDPNILSSILKEVVDQLNAGGGGGGAYNEVVAASTAYTNSTFVNIASLPLLAGTWKLNGAVMFTYLPSGGAQQISAMLGSFSTSSGVIDQSVPYASVGPDISGSGQHGPLSVIYPRRRLVLASPATVYLVFAAVIGPGTASTSGVLSAEQ